MVSLDSSGLELDCLNLSIRFDEYRLCTGSLEVQTQEPVHPPRYQDMTDWQQNEEQA